MRRNGAGTRDDVELSLTLQHELVAVQTATDLHVLVELTAPPAPAGHERQPLHVAVVLDRSGSMGGGRLEAAKASTLYLASQLQAEDRFAVIAYDHVVELTSPLQPVHLPALTSALHQVEPRGMTNLSGGWLKGLEQLEQDGPWLRRVLLLSDGHANAGLTDPVALTSVARTSRELGVSTSTVGFGEDFDEGLMTALADHGGGTGSFAETPDDAAAIFAEEFEDLATLVAQNVSVEVRPTGAVQLVEVLNSFPSTAVDGGVQVQVGDAYADRTLRVVLKLHVPSLPALGLAQIGEVKLRWVSVGEQLAQHTVTQPLTVNAVHGDEAAEQLPDATVTEEVVVLLAGRATEQARLLADAGDLDAAREVLDASLRHLRQVAPGHPAAQRLVVSAERMERTSRSLADATYDRSDAKRLYYEERELRRRRRQRRDEP